MNIDFMDAFVRYHRWHYYVSLDGAIITDDEFDSIYDSLQKHFPDSPVLSEVGAPPGSECPLKPEEA